MAKLKRDYKAEYARRIARGKAKGLSKSQARGHPKATEKLISPKRKKPIADDQLQIALQNLAKGESLTASAKDAQVSVERLRNQLKESKSIKKKANRWSLNQRIPRQWQLLSRGRVVTIVVSGKRKNALIGKYNAAVGKFLRSQDLSLLEPYKNKIIVDSSGVAHPFETNPNTIYKLFSSSNDSFENIYRIVIT